MSVLFIDGWDLHRGLADADLPGMQDFGLYNYSVPLSYLGYTAGHISGQGIREGYIPQIAWGGTAGTNGDAIPVGTNVLRVHWFTKAEALAPTAINIWYGHMMLNLDGMYVGVQMDRAGRARIARGGFYPGLPIFNPADATDEVMSGASTTVISSEWQFYEFYANFRDNVFELRINNHLECSGSLDTPHPTVSSHIQVSWNHPEDFFIDIDHLIVTDGESLVGTNKIHALAPTAAMAGWGTLRGNIIKGGASYQTTRQSPIVNVHTFGADNAYNVAYFLYPKDPSTNLPWGADAVTGLQGWGVCAGNIPDTLYMGMTSLGLSIVETQTDPNGFPIITVLKPSGLTYISGPWTKSDPSVSIAAHLNDIPRTPLRADDRWLETTVDGCLLFAGTTNNDLLQGIGITFAEEFREDFTDWYRLVNGGIPFESYFITGYTILGQGDKRFQSNYVTVNYENVPVGGAYLQGVWDYAITGDSGRWGTKQQVYRLTNADYKYQTSRLKVRGHGVSMQIKVSSQEGKDFRLSGWTVAASGNTGL